MALSQNRYFYLSLKWGGRWGSNPRPPESQSGALPTELRPPLFKLTCRYTAYLRLTRHLVNGAPGRTRTCNPQLRRLMLYPVELQALFLSLTLPINKWSGWRDSNSRPTAPKAVALPGCATPRNRLTCRCYGLS